jgi:hypothetical protein
MDCSSVANPLLIDGIESWRTHTITCSVHTRVNASPVSAMMSKQGQQNNDRDRHAYKVE